MQVSIVTDAEKVGRAIRNTYRYKLGFAMKNAINDVAFDSRRAANERTKEVFQSPVKMTTQRATEVFPKARSWNGNEIEAVVQLNEDVGKGTSPAKYLRHQVMGGERLDKRSERRLKDIGVLKPGWQMVPAREYQNKDGNIRLGLIQKILSDLRAYTYVGETYNRPTFRGGAHMRNRALTQPTYIVLPIGKAKKPGIYIRKRGKLRIVIGFMKNPTYRARYDFHDTVKRRVKEQYPRYFKLQFAKAMAASKYVARR